MIGREFHFHDGAQGAALAIRIKAGSKYNRIDKVLRDGTIVLSINSDPDDLNRDIIIYLAGQLGIEEKRLDIIAGKDDNEKIISIIDITPEELQAKVLSKIS